MYKKLFLILVLLSLEACGTGTIEEKYQLHSPCTAADVSADSFGSDATPHRVPCQRKYINNWIV